MIDYLSIENVLGLIEDLGVGPIRDIGLLDSAVHRPQVSVFGDDAYPGVDDKAAALLEPLVRNRALVDGNTRIGWLATMVFYELNATTRPAGSSVRIRRAARPATLNSGIDFAVRQSAARRRVPLRRAPRPREGPPS